VAIQRPQTYVLDGTAIGMGHVATYIPRISGNLARISMIILLSSGMGNIPSNIRHSRSTQ
jgi:hypothetical protein